jgi:hypothetical protein
VWPIVKFATATRDAGFSGEFAHRGGAPETLLCCRGPECRRDAATGKGIPCLHRTKLDAARIASAASNLFRGEETRSIIRRVASRASSWLASAPRLKSRPRKIHQFSQALSLGISGGRAFCFSAEPAPQTESARSREHVPGGDIFSRAPRFRNSHTTKKGPLAAIHGENAAPENVEIGRLANLADRKGCERGDRAHVDLARDTTGPHIGVWAQRGGPRGIPDRAGF